MEESLEPKSLDVLLNALKEHGWDCITDEASDTMVVIDNVGDYHECWNSGDSDTVNVCVAMTISDAVEYFMNPQQVGELKDENDKLRELVRDDLRPKYDHTLRMTPVEWREYDDDILRRARELGVEVN